MKMIKDFLFKKDLEVDVVVDVVNVAVDVAELVVVVLDAMVLIVIIDIVMVGILVHDFGVVGGDHAVGIGIIGGPPRWRWGLDESHPPTDYLGD